MIRAVIIFLLLFVFLESHIFANEPNNVKPFSMVCHDVSLDSLFRQLGESIDKEVFYASNIFKEKCCYSIDHKDKYLNNFFKTLFPKSHIKYKIEGNALLIIDKVDIDVNEYRYSGHIFGSNGSYLDEVLVQNQDKKILGVTDSLGYFYVEASDPITKLSFLRVGFQSLHLLFPNTDKEYELYMTVKEVELEEIVVRGTSKQKRYSVVGAISTLNLKDREVVGNDIGSYLAGRLSGVISVNRIGEPGRDNSSIFVRGIGTYAKNKNPLILVDGVEANLNDVSSYDISSVSLLKDGSLTSEFGMLGANGVLMIETKNGLNTPNSLTIDYATAIVQPTSLPKYLSGLEYAMLSNEARVVRGHNPFYSDAELKIIKYNLDNNFYPNVNWQEEALRHYSIEHEMHIAASGRDESIAYYIAGGYQNRGSILNTENFDYQRMFVRANLDIPLFVRAKFSSRLGGGILRKKTPYSMTTEDVLFQSIAKLNPLVLPISFSDGTLPANSNDKKSYSPYVLLNHSGTNAFVDQNFSYRLRYDQSLLNAGNLNYYLLFKGNMTAQHTTHRMSIPALYRADRYDISNDLVTEKIVDAQRSYSKIDPVYHWYYSMDAGIDYQVDLPKHHFQFRLTGMISQYKHTKVLKYNVPRRYLSSSFKLLHDWDKTFFTELDIAMMGADSYRTDGYFDLFPSFATGVVLSRIPRFYLEPIKFLKLRGSVGVVGNDVSRSNPTIIDHSEIPGKWGDNGLKPGFVDHNFLGWEKALKWNIGCDLNTNHLQFNLDYYYHLRKGISQVSYSLPQEVGESETIYLANGRMSSWGVDLSIKYRLYQTLDIQIDLFSNVTWTENKILYKQEDLIASDYHAESGNPYGEQSGLVALGLFSDSLDIMSSPRHDFGRVYPGDIKYKDVNGDGVINHYDRVTFGTTDIPKWMYGFGLDFKVKRFRGELLFAGAHGAHTLLSGEGVFPFFGEQEGNVLESVQENRWIPSWYSGSTKTEKPDALYPRLTWGKNQNNSEPSTFWLREMNFLKLKSVTVSYTLPMCTLHQLLNLQEVKWVLKGHNLLNFSRFKEWDPEQTFSNGAVYPLMRSYILELEIKI